MIDDIKDILNLLKDNGLTVELLVILSLTLLLWRFVWNANCKAFENKEKSDSYNTRVNWIKEDKFGVLYQSVLGSLLDTVSRWIGDTKNLQDSKTDCRTKKKGICKLFGFNPWSEPSFKISLFLAFLYPMMIFLFFWVMGADGSFAGVDYMSFKKNGLELFIPVVTRRILFLLFLGFTILFIYTFKSRKNYSMVLIIFIPLFFLIFAYFEGGNYTRNIDFIFIIFVIFFVPIYVGGLITAYILMRSKSKAHKQIFTFAVTVAVAVVFAISVASISASISADTAAPAFALTGAFALASVFVFAGAGTFAYASAIVGAFTFGVIVAGKGAFIVAIAFAGILYVIVNFLYQRSHKKNFFWFFYTLIFLLLGFIALYYANKNYKILILFYLILPLINAPLDWLSLGMTRGLLEAIRSGHHPGLQGFFWGLADLILALIFLVLMSAITVVTFTLSGVADIPAYLRGITFDINYYWIFVMVLSTLIPTLVHFLLASAAFIFWLPEGWRHRIVTRLDQSTDKTTVACFYLTFTPIVGIILPILFGYLLFWYLIPNFGVTILEALREFLIHLSLFTANTFLN